nr:immunoglobulin heavy chain junction region [Macaca mulatta]MOW94471.1 immunoglobulin heavy chain junction region [Macaca mulatta]MOW95640.1 immunoglobulin heavy chain junction region [Macaca mulatta]MOW95797.1 immunoglobulin heavy chain junction region [Macaca mulatta]MOW95961.1 immunoglobulin heavy chain junction region [Macaca mulatta]
CASHIPLRGYTNYYFGSW